MKNCVEIEDLVKKIGFKPQIEGGLIFENHYKFDGPGRASSGQIYYFFKPDVPTAFHTIDCDEYWAYACGDDLDVWLINPDGKLQIKKLGTSEANSELCIYIKKGLVFAAKPSKHNGRGTLITAITVPRYSDSGFELYDERRITDLCPEAKTFFIN